MMWLGIAGGGVAGIVIVGVLVLAVMVILHSLRSWWQNRGKRAAQRRAEQEAQAIVRSRLGPTATVMPGNVVVTSMSSDDFVGFYLDEMNERDAAKARRKASGYPDPYPD